MSYCDYCGQHIEFRYIGGTLRPLHSCDGRGGATSSPHSHVRFGRYDDGECVRTTCPHCKQSVFFIRHNGGSFWVDPPLGPPWPPHECMVAERLSNGDRREGLVSHSDLPKFGHLKGLRLGVVRAFERSPDYTFTIVEVSTGEPESELFVLKRAADFLLGRAVVLDSSGFMLRWVENADIAFRILANLRPADLDQTEKAMVPCPACNDPVLRPNLLSHLQRVHGFTRPEWGPVIARPQRRRRRTQPEPEV